MIITSLSNPRIKWIRKLRDKKAREESGCFWAEGLRVVIEAAQQAAIVETLVVAPDLLTSPAGHELTDSLRKQGAEILEVSADVFKSMAFKEAPVGLAAVIHQRWQNLADVQIRPGDLWIALDQVADPGNLGTILRTSDAVGGNGVILLDHSTDPYDPTAIRASMGALFSQGLVKASFEQLSLWKKANQVPIIGTSGAASQDYQAYHYPMGLVLLMGSEREGLPESRLAICDQVVRIPMVGKSDSLNLAVATAVAAYEIFNQRRQKEVKE